MHGINPHISYGNVESTAAPIIGITNQKHPLLGITLQLVGMLAQHDFAFGIHFSLTRREKDALIEVDLGNRLTLKLGIIRCY
jgi:hypothetical protein